MQQSSRAGASIVCRLAQHSEQLAGGRGAAASAAAGAGDQLDACLHFLSLLAGSGGAGVQAALLLCLPRLLPLAGQERATSRRLLLDVLASLLPAAQQLSQGGATAPGSQLCSSPQVACSNGSALERQPEPRPIVAALLSAVVGRLHDRDASLRGKALGCLERHSALLAGQLSRQGGNGSPAAASTDAGASSRDAFLSALCSRWADIKRGLAGAPRGECPQELLPALLCTAPIIVVVTTAAAATAAPARLCDRSPSVRKRAISLLAALLSQPALLPAGTAVLAGAVLPVAARLLRARPDSGLHPGDESMAVLSQAVFDMVGSSGAGPDALLHLLQLGSCLGAGAGGCHARVQAAVLAALVPSTGGGDCARTAGQAQQQRLDDDEAAGSTALVTLEATLQRCSRRQAEQLRTAVQGALAKAGRSTTAGVAAAVRQCYGRLHRQCCGHLQPVQPEGGGIGTVATALCVLGPLSSADPEAGRAEAGLLLTCVHCLAASSAGGGGSSSSRDGSPGQTASSALESLLAALSAALQQLGAAATSLDSCQALLQGVPTVVQAVLLSPAGSSKAVRRGALAALSALPAAALAPVHLLRCLTHAAAAEEAATAPAHSDWLAMAADPAGKQLQLQLERQAGAEATGEGDGINGSSSAVPLGSAGGRQQQQRRRQALLAVLELLGSMASGYQQQRAEFLSELKAEGGDGQEQRQGGTGDPSPSDEADDAGHTAPRQPPPPPPQQQRSKAGRLLRPAAEWWVGEGRPAGAGVGASSHPHTVAEAEAGAHEGFDYMEAADEAAKAELAAQRLLDSLLARRDTPPACYLPLLQQLAAGTGEGGQQQQQPAPPAEVRAAALRALGRLSLLSEAPCGAAVALAERCLLQRPVASGRDTDGGSGDGGGGEGGDCSPPPCCVQLAAVEVLAGAVDAFPNSYGDRLGLLGSRMLSGPTVVAAAATSGSVAGGSPGQEQAVAFAAAAAYSRLLLSNKLKLQGALGPAGSALAASSECGTGGSNSGSNGSAAGGVAGAVAAVVGRALGQLLGAAASGPRERARLALDLFHQTPLRHRRAAAEVR